jgi:hypothetical protein
MPVPEAAVARADVIVGLMTQNDSRTVPGVTHAVHEGLTRHFGGRVPQLVVADAASTDGTVDAVRAAAGALPVHVIERPSSATAELPYHGQTGRAGALRAVLQLAREQGAACAIVDARRQATAPETILRLLGPIVDDGMDYVAPYYVRRAHEGAITRGIVYPLCRALYGARLRQPAATELGLSTRLVDHVLDQDLWDADHADAGIDLWLAIEAACAGMRMCEASLGVRATAPLDTPVDLSTTLRQVVGALFADLEQRADVWQRPRRSEAVPVVGDTPEPPGDRPPAHIDALREQFRLGYRELREIWTWVLPPRTIVDLRRLTDLPQAQFRFEDRLWATILYDFAIGYRLRVLPQDHLLRSLTPIYAGWMAAFIAGLADAPLAGIEARVEQICAAFETEKRYLIARWRWPERLR